MAQTLQVLQVILFAIPSLVLAGIGVIILRQSVSLVNRRWFLAVLIPLLIANTLTIFTENGPLNLNWRTWLMLAANAVLIIGSLWVTHGIQVYGLSVELVEQVLTALFLQQGFTVNANSIEKGDVWGRTRDARRLSAVNGEQTHVFWITKHFNEVLVRAKQSTGSKLLGQSLPALQAEKVPYDFKAHTAGVLYIVLALVFAVLTWIFFYEPRLILIE